MDDGSQIVAPRDKDIINKVRSITDFKKIKTISEEEAVKKGYLMLLEKEMDDKYIETLKNKVLNPEIVREQGKDLKIVYTPLHGTGNTIAERLLNELGFKNVYVVPEQAKPDEIFQQLTIQIQKIKRHLN